MVKAGYRLDLLVEGQGVVELKAVEALQEIHRAQLLTYLKLGNWPIGLLMNFNLATMREEVRRVIHNASKRI